MVKSSGASSPYPGGDPQPLPAPLCPLCGSQNQCAPANAGRFDVECWCKSAVIPPELLQQLPASLMDKACLCPRCARLVAGSAT